MSVVPACGRAQNYASQPRATRCSHDLIPPFGLRTGFSPDVWCYFLIELLLISASLFLDRTAYYMPVYISSSDATIPSDYPTLFNGNRPCDERHLFGPPSSGYIFPNQHSSDQISHHQDFSKSYYATDSLFAQIRYVKRIFDKKDLQREGGTSSRQRATGENMEKRNHHSPISPRGTGSASLGTAPGT